MSYSSEQDSEIFKNIDDSDYLQNFFVSLDDGPAQADMVFKIISHSTDTQNTLIALFETEPLIFNTSTKANGLNILQAAIHKKYYDLAEKIIEKFPDAFYQKNIYGQSAYNLLPEKQKLKFKNFAEIHKNQLLKEDVNALSHHVNNLIKNKNYSLYQKATHLQYVSLQFIASEVENNDKQKVFNTIIDYLLDNGLKEYALKIIKETNNPTFIIDAMLNMLENQENKLWAKRFWTAPKLYDGTRKLALDEIFKQLLKLPDIKSINHYQTKINDLFENNAGNNLLVKRPFQTMLEVICQLKRIQNTPEGSFDELSISKHNIANMQNKKQQLSPQYAAIISQFEQDNIVASENNGAVFT